MQENDFYFSNKLFASKWEKFTSKYIVFIGKIMYFCKNRIIRYVHIKEISPAIFSGITFIILVFVTTFFLTSCFHGGQNDSNTLEKDFFNSSRKSADPSASTSFVSSNNPNKKPEIQKISKEENKFNRREKTKKAPQTLFIQKKNIFVEKKENGSKTGSIWADATAPRDLFSEYAPSRIGEIITVEIAEDLQYISPLNDDLKNKTPTPPVKSVKFEIVSIDPTGDVLLKAAKDLSSSAGLNRGVNVTAKIPRRLLKNFKIGAEALTKISVVETNNAHSFDYSVTGWDKNISQKLSVFNTDANSDLLSTEDVKRELILEKESLKEQKNAITQDKERLERDKRRLRNEALSKGNLDAIQEIGLGEAANAVRADEPQFNSPPEPTRTAPPPPNSTTNPGGNTVAANSSTTPAKGAQPAAPAAKPPIPLIPPPPKTPVSPK